MNRPLRGPRRPRRNGMAMIIILGTIVLITLLVVGFIGRTGTERKSMANYRAVSSVRQLSDTVVNLVEAQINDATTQTGGTAWASQPGAVRVFDNGGQLKTVYKLYSSDSLTTGTASDLANDVPTASWPDSPALWVDLNAPAATQDGAGTTRKVFPILDPRNPQNQNQLLTTLDGFSLDNPPGAVTASSDPHYQPVPMPVRWLYVLQDGQLIAPDGGGNGQVATFGNAATKPDAQNPIVGRVAFWADDDTSKININTAADGTFWDTPHFNTIDDQNRASFQPARGEFQSYPGHPATTSLYPLLNALGARFGTYPAASQGSESDFFKVLPRYDDDYGSKLGTVLPTVRATPKSDRLYASVGELLFDKNRTPGLDGFTREQMETGKFFLTAHSRAPEVNLFGMPRIAIWPLADSPGDRTPIDSLIAFCSTVNGQPYYFTRKNAASPTDDAFLPRNITLLQYLDFLTQKGVPGVTASTFDGKYPTGERRQILTEIFDYIRTVNLLQPSLDGQTYPQYAQVAPLGTASAQGQVAPTVLHSAPLNWSTQGFGRFPVISEMTMLFTGAGRGKDASIPGDTGIPIDPQQPSMGTPGPPADGQTAVQAFLVFEMFNPMYGYSQMNLGLTIRITGLDGFKLTTSGPSSSNALGMASPAVFSITDAQSNPAAGFSYSNGHAAVIDPRIFLFQRKAGSSPNQYPFYSAIVNVPGLASQGGLMSLNQTSFTVEVYAGSAVSASNLIQTYNVKFPSCTLPLPKVLPHYDPVPNPAPAGFAPWRLCSKDTRGSSPSAERFDYVYDRWYNYVFNGNYDTMISVVPTKAFADYRLFGSGTIPVNAFALHPLNSFTRSIAVNLRSTWGPESPQGSTPNLSTGGSYSGGGNVLANTALARGSAGEGSNSKLWLPCVPPTLTTGAVVGATTTPGDWDNAMGDDTCTAGPFLNKPDEGSVAAGYYGQGQPNSQKGVTDAYFSPNRQISSPVMFGSLPTGVKRNLGWQTLLFRPGPPGHPGSNDPKDHYLLDLFWMPVVEPYAISEPFSTAGKVNLNYQIVPFTYITRNTALRAVLASEKVAQVPKTVGTSTPARYGLNLSETGGTLRQFVAKFRAWDIFRSATELCDIYLVPSNESWGDTTAQSGWYGSDFLRVGDNMRERPYSSLYARVTTKSNTFTVYYIVQALKTPTILAKANAAQWNEDTGAILGTYRGSTTLERYLDPNDASIPDYASNPAEAKTLEQYYRWRVVENTQFAP